MSMNRLGALAVAVALALSACSASPDDEPEATGSSPSTAATDAPATGTPAYKRRVNPCSLISRAMANKTTERFDLTWKKPERDKGWCHYTGEPFVFMSVTPDDEEPAAAIAEWKSTCSTLPVELSETSFVCNASTGDLDYAAVGVIQREGRVWTLIINIKEGGINDTARQALLGWFLVELEGLNPKVLRGLVPS